MLKKEQLPRLLSIFFLLLPILYPIYWHSNELYYFGLAKHHISPVENSMLYAVNNQQYSRFVNDFTIGIFIKLFGEDQAWSILRFIILIAFSFSISNLTHTLKIALLPTLATLILFLLLGQTYFAGEWLFGGVEAKTFAYPLVLFGLDSALNKRLNLAIFFFILAGYFHFLVGGFWGTACFIYLYLTKRNIPLIKYYLLFILGFLPIIFMIIYENKILPKPDLTGIPFTINQIYSNIRHPHHVAPFHDGHLNTNWLIGVLFIFTNSLILFLLHSYKFKNDQFIVWVLMLNLYLLLGLSITYFDRTSQYLGKFYLLRPASLTLLLTLFIIASTLYDYLKSYKSVIMLGSLLIIAAIILPIVKKAHTVKQYFGMSLFDTLPQEEKQLIYWVKKQTPPNATVLFEEGKGGVLSVENFEQLAGRASIVNWKFVPITNYEIANWYRMINLKKRAYSGDCSAFVNLTPNYVITLSEQSYGNTAKCGETVMTTGQYHVIKLR